jgi:hypothetical protein
MMTSKLVWSVLGLNVATFDRALEATLLECPDQSGRVAGIPPSRNTGCGQRPTLTTVIDKTFPFDQPKEAFTYMASGAHFGKVAIAIG